MFGEKLTFAENNCDMKKEKHMKRRKKKFSSVSDESGRSIICRTPKIFSNKFSPKRHKNSDTTKLEIAKCFGYKNSRDYIKIVAKPESLKIIPKIFEIGKPKHGELDTSDCFLFNILSMKSFNSDVKERFNQRMINRNIKEKKKEKNLKKNNAEENFTNSIKIKEKIEKKGNKIKKQEKIAISVRQSKGNVSEGESCLNKKTENIIGSSIDIYKVSQNKALIFHIHHPGKFSFHGEIKVTVIKGEIEVLGFTLSSSSNKNSANMYSPNLCTPLVVETKPLKANVHLEEIESKLKHLLTENDYRKLLTNLRPDDSILLIEEIRSDFGIVIEKYFEKSIFPKDLEDVSSMTETLKTLQSIFTFQLPEGEKYLKKSPQWDRIPLSHCTVLCGGKGVGKSTLLKYYINKLVTLGEKVLCLDFDPGQPEFTFPGCISAVVIDQPVIGPNFTHVLDPVLMMSFGDVDVTSNPFKYLECVKYVIENYRKNEELMKMKCFVNTMGFCKGLGVNLMINILKLLQPTTVIQIKGSDYRNNYPFYLTPTVVNSRNGFGLGPVSDMKLSYDLRLIYTCAENNKKQFQGGLKQRQLQNIMCLSYFSKMVSPPFYNFNAVQPYLISFSKLYLGIDFLIDPKDILKAFNGSIVSLSHLEPDTEEIFSVESEEDTYIKIVVKPNIAPSLGIGFVRGVDCKGNKLYLMTHLSVEILNNVNCLSLGKINPPHSMFIKQETVENQKMYTTSGTVDKIRRVNRIYRVPGMFQKLEIENP